MVLPGKQAGRLWTGRSPWIECPGLQTGSAGRAKLWSLFVPFSTCENRPCGPSEPFPRLLSCEDSNTALGALAPLFLVFTVLLRAVGWGKFPPPHLDAQLWVGNETWPLLLRPACLLVCFPLSPSSPGSELLLGSE